MIRRVGDDVLLDLGLLNTSTTVSVADVSNVSGVPSDMVREQLTGARPIRLRVALTTTIELLVMMDKKQQELEQAIHRVLEIHDAITLQGERLGELRQALHYLVPKGGSYNLGERDEET